MDRAPRVYLGIDPGYSGAIAKLVLTDGGADDDMTLTLYDMPTHALRVNRKHTRRLDLYALATWMDAHAAGATRATIEDPNVLPNQGIVSSGNFMFACGAAQMAVAAHLIPVVLCKPRVWKQEMNLPGGAEGKDAARRRATQLFPHHTGWFTRKCDDGRAEAALLAWYGSRLP